MYLIKVYHKATNKVVDRYYSITGEEKYPLTRGYAMEVCNLTPAKRSRSKEASPGSIKPKIRIK